MTELPRDPAPLPRGVFTLSIDTELAWGGFDRPDREQRWRQEEGSREVVRRLLALFERHRISATWAVVGHLFLERCNGGGPVAHPEIPRPYAPWFSRDWYSLDPRSSASEAPLWYAPDLIRLLRQASPTQEIASHSFAHLVFGDSGCSADAAAGDLAACEAAAGDWGLNLRSFVFPRNRVGHLPLLPRYGFICYRGPDPTWFEPLPRPLRRAAHFLDDLAGLPPPTVLPQFRSGLWDLPGTMMWQGRDGPRRLLPLGSRVRKALAGLREAARRRRLFHLWFHPVNFVADREAQLAAFERVLAAAAGRRDRGELEILTMASFTARLEGAATGEA